MLSRLPFLRRLAVAPTWAEGMRAANRGRNSGHGTNGSGRIVRLPARAL